MNDRVRAPRKGRVLRSITSKTIAAMKPGDCATFSTPLRTYKASPQTARSTYSANIASYASRAHPGASWGYVSFWTIDESGEPIVGLRLTRNS